MAIKVNWPSQHWTYYSYDIILTWMLLNSLACKIAETTKRTLVSGMDALAHMPLMLGQSPHQHWTRKHLSFPSHPKVKFLSEAIARADIFTPFPLSPFLSPYYKQPQNQSLHQQVFIEFPLCGRYCPRFQGHSKNKIFKMSCFCLSPHLRVVTDKWSIVMFQKSNTY